MGSIFVTWDGDWQDFRPKLHFCATLASDSDSYIYHNVNEKCQKPYLAGRAGYEM